MLRAGLAGTAIVVLAMAAAIVMPAVAEAAPAAVRDAGGRLVYPYCAISGGAGISYEECRFATFELCLEEIRGLGGYCRPNAYYPAAAFAGAPPARRGPKRHRH